MKTSKSRQRASAIAIAIALLALTVGYAQPPAAQAAPAGCTGTDAPPACGGQPPAPPVLLSTPRFTPEHGVNYFRVAFALDPATVTAYAAGSSLPYRAYIDCSNGFSGYFSMILAADRRNAYSELKGWSLAEGETCTVNTDAWVALHLSHANIDRQSTESSMSSAWVASFR